MFCIAQCLYKYLYCLDRFHMVLLPSALAYLQEFMLHVMHVLCFSSTLLHSNPRFTPIRDALRGLSPVGPTHRDLPAESDKHLLSLQHENELAEDQLVQELRNLVRTKHCQQPR